MAPRTYSLKHRFPGLRPHLRLLALHVWHNQLVVAQHNVITFVAPGRLGDRLEATAREVARFGRSGLYDVRVTDQSGRLIAEFRGASRAIEGRHFDEDAA